MAKKKKKNNKKLLLQIGLSTLCYSLLVAAIAFAVLYVTCLLIYFQAKGEQMEETLGRVKRHALFNEDEVTPVIPGKLMDYIEENPDIMVRAMAVDESPEISPEQERYAEYCQEYEGQYGTPEFYESFPEDLIEYAARDAYWSVFFCLTSEQEQYRYEELMLLDLTEGYEGTVLYYVDAEEEHLLDRLFIDIYEEGNENACSDYMEQHGFGKVWEGADKNDAFQEFLNDGEERMYYNLEPNGGEELCITGLFPVFIDGKPRYALVITSDLMGFQEKMGTYSKLVVGLEIPAIVITEAVLLILLYFLAVRPLRKVKRSLTRYTEDKDGDRIVQEMEKIRQRNEFGALANDIAELAKEIERYTKENVELAGEKERVATELEMATKIQSGMLRRDFPVTPEYEIYALMDPAKEVGGDFYDFFELDETHEALVIGDVSGKGVPGALFMMSAQTTLRQEAQKGGKPSEILERVNHELLKGDLEFMFVTIWLGILDKENGIIIAANAGHEDPMVRTGERFERLKDPHGFVVAGIEGVKYKDYEIPLSEDATVFVYTDGVPEATAADESMYGVDRILEVLNRTPDAAPGELAEGVKADVEAFVGEAEQFDDLTILCIRYRKK